MESDAIDPLDPETRDERRLRNLARTVAAWSRMHPTWTAGRLWQHIYEAHSIAEVEDALRRQTSHPGPADDDSGPAED